MQLGVAEVQGDALVVGHRAPGGAVGLRGFGGFEASERLAKAICALVDAQGLCPVRSVPHLGDSHACGHAVTQVLPLLLPQDEPDEPGELEGKTLLG